MKYPLTILMAAGGLAGASPASAQVSFTFGPWTGVGPAAETTQTLRVSARTDAIQLNTQFSALVTFTPAVDTPRDATYAYTITFASVKIEVASASGSLTPDDPAEIVLGNLQQTVNVYIPPSGAPPGGIEVPFGPFTKEVLVALTPTSPFEELTVRWTAISGLNVSGGKGVDSYVGAPVLSGVVTAVPEVAEYAWIAGLGLAVFAGWRRYQR
jgi:hypothetical protein